VGRADSSLRSSSTVQSRCYCSRAARWRREEAEREEEEKDGIEEVICICICMCTRRKVGLSLGARTAFLRTCIARVLISIGCQSFRSISRGYPKGHRSLVTAYYLLLVTVILIILIDVAMFTPVYALSSRNFDSKCIYRKLFSVPSDRRSIR
jgi:hypothetical protein